LGNCGVNKAREKAREKDRYARSDQAAPGDNAVAVQMRHHIGRGLAGAGVGAEARAEPAGGLRFVRAAMVAQKGHLIRHDATCSLLEQLPTARAAGPAASLR